MKKGFALVELVVALGVFSIIVFAAIRLFVVSQEVSVIGEKKIQAQALATEYFEEIKNLRRQDWSLLTNGRYVFQNLAGNLSLAPTTDGETVGNFTRFLEINNTYRDQEGNLVETGGTLDPSTKKLTVFVSWGGLFPRNFSQTTYLTRYLDNLAWTQTTVADFEAGEMDLVKIVDPVIDDGEIQLEGGCFTGTPESLIYDDELRNGWRVNCEGLPLFQRFFCRVLRFFANAEITTDATDYTYKGSPHSMKVALKPPSMGGLRSWARIYNYEGICTVGFKNLHFYAYNPSPQPLEFDLTAVYPKWERAHIVLPPGGWEEISLDYEDINEDYETNLQAIYFSKFLFSWETPVVFYLDQMELTGGVGGYFTEGTLTSSVLDTDHSSAFNRIGFDSLILDQTQIGMQTAVSDNPDGPWVFYGPGGTGLNDDLYTTPEGEGIWLGANIGQYFKYKAYLKSLDGKNTPILYEVTVNYSP